MHNKAYIIKIPLKKTVWDMADMNDHLTLILMTTTSTLLLKFSSSYIFISKYSKNNMI